MHSCGVSLHRLLSTLSKGGAGAAVAKGNWHFLSLVGSRLSLLNTSPAEGGVRGERILVALKLLRQRGHCYLGASAFLAVPVLHALDERDACGERLRIEV